MFPLYWLYWGFPIHHFYFERKHRRRKNYFKYNKAYQHITDGEMKLLPSPHCTDCAGFLRDPRGPSPRVLAAKPRVEQFHFLFLLEPLLRISRLVERARPPQHIGSRESGRKKQTERKFIYYIHIYIYLYILCI